MLWKDNRNAPASAYEQPVQLFARIFDISAEEVTGSVDIDLEAEPWTDLRHPALQAPGVAKFGRYFMVAWLTPYRHVYGRMISESGELQPKLFEFTPFATAYGTPGVAANQRHCLVVWETFENGSNQVSARVMSRNNPTPGPIIEIARNVGPMEPMVSPLGNSFLVVWKERQWPGVIHAALVTARGKVKKLDHWQYHNADQYTLAGNRRECFIIRSVNNFTGNPPLAFHVNRRGKYTQELHLDGYPRECVYLSAVDTACGGFAAVWFNGLGTHQAVSSTRRTAADCFPQIQSLLTNTPPVLTRSGSKFFIVQEELKSTTNGLASRVTLMVVK